MRGAPRLLVAVLAAAMLALAGCGGGDDGDAEKSSDTPTSVPEGAVAVVGETEISREDYDAWSQASVAQAGGEPLKGDALRDQVMQFLLSSEWILQEAEARGIEASDEEVRQQFEDQKKQSFPKEADYQEFLRTSGQTEEQLMFRVRLDLLSNKVRDEVVRDVASPKEQEVLDEFVQDFEKRYREITLCADDYVTEDCSNSKEPAGTPEEPEEEEDAPGPIDRLLEP